MCPICNQTHCTTHLIFFGRTSASFFRHNGHRCFYIRHLLDILFGPIRENTLCNDKTQSVTNNSHSCSYGLSCPALPCPMANVFSMSSGIAKYRFFISPCRGYVCVRVRGRTAKKRRIFARYIYSLDSRPHSQQLHFTISPCKSLVQIRCLRKFHDYLYESGDAEFCVCL